MRSMVSRTRSRITRSMVSAATSRPSPGSRFLLSLPMASSSGTRCPAGAVVGQLRRMMTPSFHFSTTRPTLPWLAVGGHSEERLYTLFPEAPATVIVDSTVHEPPWFAPLSHWLLVQRGQTCEADVK